MTAFHFKPSWHLAESLITPETTYFNRRQVLKSLGLGTLAMTLPQLASADSKKPDERAMTRPALGEKYRQLFPAKRNESFSLGNRPLTLEKIAARHNNFYEFTTAKDRVWELAQKYVLPPWQVEVTGLVKKERTLDLDDIFTRFPLEERLYRFRCVERWAMQIPWTGFPLRLLIDYLEPLGTAKYVQFQSILDKKKLPGQKRQRWYPWPYYEGLRLDEARHDLAFVAVGSYGHALPMQHGAPFRLALPWKYGYKSPKSLVKIEFTDKEPATFWNKLHPAEYGFYSNVEPQKPHPRWSQQWETDIGTQETRETLLYNGYAEQVGSLYDGSEV